jgi:hypothetical protein
MNSYRIAADIGQENSLWLINQKKTNKFPNLGLRSVYVNLALV